MLEWLFGKKKQPEKKQKQKDKDKEKEKVKKPNRSKKQQEQEDKWMYDFLVEFLNSPVWRVKILDFTDSKCIVFDNEEENKFQYTIIHNQFKQLVGNLFDGWISEVGVPQQKLAELLQRGFMSKQKKLFNQLLLCDDFMKFKQLMLKRNKTLEEETIRAMRGQARKPSKIETQRAYLLKTQKEEEQRRRHLQKEEQQTLRKVIQMSMKEAQQNEAIKKLQQATFAHQIKQSQINFQKPQQSMCLKKQNIDKSPEKQQGEKQIVQKDDRKQRIRAKLRKEKLKAINQPENNQSDNLGSLPPLKTNFKVNQPNETFSKAQEKQINENKPIQEPIKVEQPKEQQKTVYKKQIQTQQDRKKRHLEQREKIRKIKQLQRQKMLQQSHADQHNGLNIVLQQDGIHDSHLGNQNRGFQEQTEEVKISKDQLERRKALMKKIKNRIVDDF